MSLENAGVVAVQGLKRRGGPFAFLEEVPELGLELAGGRGAQEAGFGRRQMREGACSYRCERRSDA